MKPHLALLALAAAILACQARSDGTVALPSDTPATTQRRDEPPLPLNADSPIRYPDPLAAQRLGGTVILRLFVDSGGQVIADSSAIQESSGYPALDSAALRGVPQLRYAPALRDGIPVSAPFLQPVDFRVTGTTPR
jgi:TonB family protein